MPSSSSPSSSSSPFSSPSPPLSPPSVPQDSFNTKHSQQLRQQQLQRQRQRQLQQEAEEPPSWRRRIMADAIRLMMLQKARDRTAQDAASGGILEKNGATVETNDHPSSLSSSSSPVAMVAAAAAAADPAYGGDATVESADANHARDVDVMEAAGYATMNWWQCGMLMVAETVSLGILTLPRAVANLGLVPGITVLIGMGLMAAYTGYVIGQFALVHRSVQSMTDAGQIILGKFGRELCFWGANGFIIFIMGSHLLVFRKMMDALTDNRYCGMAWTAVAFFVSFVFCLPRRCKKMVLLSAASFASIFVTVVVVIVDIVIHRPADAPQQQQHPHFDPVRAWPKPGLEFHHYFNSISNIAFAYAGHVAFYVFIAELKDRRDFTKALAFLQISDITMYTITGTVIYVFARDNVKAPAIESASPLFVKIGYGLASITIVIAGVINGHVVAKALYKMYFAKTPSVMGENTCRARLPWYVINVCLWLVAYLLAESIPVFSNIVGLSGALFASWFTFGIPSFYWFHMAFTREEEQTAGDAEKDVRSSSSGSGGSGASPTGSAPAAKASKWGDKVRRWRQVMKSWNKRTTWVLFVWNCFIVFVAVAICVIGIYSSARSIQDEAGTIGRPFSCKH